MFLILSWHCFGQDNFNPTLYAKAAKIKYQHVFQLNNNNLKSELKKIVALGHHSLGYDRAKVIMFTKLDRMDGQICSVYSPSECVIEQGLPDNRVMNCEHTWPKSLGARGTYAKSDLHHLFPTTNYTNSMRSSLPFCEVDVIKWSYLGSKRGFDVEGHHCFEPPDNHKGNVARALFYFAIRYGYPIEDKQEAVLRRWHFRDCVDRDDIIRNLTIKEFQKNTNIFVELPELVNLIENF
ncbi:MAG: endonuclease [Bacteriovoracaceae bacterium]|nr:endonuclease [Bacteriovoracaceae bacterium]